MITYGNRKCTATQFAKLTVADSGDTAHYFDEHSYDVEGFTEKEKQDCHDAISRQLARVYKFLNVSEIWNKINCK